jgi:integrase
VFCREDGSVLSPEWLTRRAKKLVSEAGLPWLGIHAGFRHGWASWALEAGVPAKVVQERLGHSSIAITLDRYSHLTDGMDRSAAETVAEVFGK